MKNDDFWRGYAENKREKDWLFSKRREATRQMARRGLPSLRIHLASKIGIIFMTNNLYKTGERMINADLNGSTNILRKCLPNALKKDPDFSNITVVKHPDLVLSNSN